MHCVDVKSGALRWSSSVALPTDENTEIKSAPVILDEAGIVIAGTHGGTAAAMSALDGLLLWRLHLPGAIFSTPLLVPDTGELYICVTRGQSVFKFCCAPDTNASWLFY